MKNYLCYRNADGEYKKKVFSSISSCFRNHPEYRQWVKNLYNEHFITEEKMVEILEILHETQRSPDEMKFKLLKSHGYKSLCCGGKCDIGVTSINVGTVIPKRRFRNYLIDEYSHLFTKLSIDDFISLLSYNITAIEPKFYKIPIKEIGRIIWLTWDNKTFSNNPFMFLKSHYTAEVLTALGLGFKDYVNQEFLSFVFPTNTDTVTRPTICDSAYNDFFRPTNPTFKKHGLIYPLNYGFYIVNGTPDELNVLALDLPESVNWGNEYSIKDLVDCFIIKPS